MCDGSVTTACACANVKRAPPAASRSRFGVCARPPYDDERVGPQRVDRDEQDVLIGVRLEQERQGPGATATRRSPTATRASCVRQATWTHGRRASVPHQRVAADGAPRSRRGAASRARAFGPTPKRGGRTGHVLRDSAETIRQSLYDNPHLARGAVRAIARPSRADGRRRVPACSEADRTSTRPRSLAGICRSTHARTSSCASRIATFVPTTVAGFLRATSKYSRSVSAGCERAIERRGKGCARVTTWDPASGGRRPARDRRRRSRASCRRG